MQSLNFNMAKSLSDQAPIFLLPALTFIYIHLIFLHVPLDPKYAKALIIPQRFHALPDLHASTYTVAFAWNILSLLECTLFLVAFLATGGRMRTLCLFSHSSGRTLAPLISDGCIHV